MSKQYDEYIVDHKANVIRGYDWLRDNLSDLFQDIMTFALDHQIYCHDDSKSELDEYDAYDTYFYSGNKTSDITQNFTKAWLMHIHRNPHHWQYWILINDDPEEGEIILDMPFNYIIEMICDWWAFSWAKGNLYEIFDWYEGRKDYIKLGPNTRTLVEDILSKIRTKLDELKEK